MQGVAADIRICAAKFASRQRWGDDEADDEEMSAPSPSKREILAKEAADLVAQQKRLSVRDLASKFEKGQSAAQSAASKLAENARLQEALMLDTQELVSKLSNLLKTLAGRVAGRNKDDVEEAATLLEALRVQLAKREAALAEEKADLHKMAALFKQASADAKNMVEEARRVAQAEIEAARAAVSRAEETLAEHERTCSEEEKMELEALRLEVQEARRIKMLHQPSRVMDMEYKLQALQQQINEKSAEIVALRNQLEASRNGESDKLFHLNNAECLGSCLQVAARQSDAPELTECSFQWQRISMDGGRKDLISGAIKSQYAPEPFDVGRLLRVEITLPDGRKEYLSTSGPIDAAPGLGNYVEALARRGGAEFTVVVVQLNGEYLQKQSLHVLEIAALRLKLKKGRTTKVKEPYSTAMQFCGARGGGEAAPLAVYWLVKQGLSFMLAFQSERERNAAIMLARRFALDCNVSLAGPQD